MSTVEKAVALAAHAFAGRKDDEGQPRLLSALRFMLKMPGEREMIATILQGTHVGAETLRKEGFDQDIITAVDHLTQREGEDYVDYLSRLREDPLARSVKLTELNEALDLARMREPRDADKRRIERYRRSLHALKDEDAV